ncbi:endonuclease/exonuclease/phosphatase family protein [Besnoitia besnoiti]|uniref:Endonuclease/exonuclease/phosphatase family protein n=1 Tax=Besnoitia besnoiti TaxID=94643 RepID=A0A2A9MPT8_BESBE|nr:endonuclease/exonuclease/phosphatase family protein [Besnoitia besnoiti]PFH38107.1 endonuclease/exonuclease/phosphatase family protein [Besnoitia besnoiti]
MRRFHELADVVLGVAADSVRVLGKSILHEGFSSSPFEEETVSDSDQASTSAASQPISATSGAIRSSQQQPPSLTGGTDTARHASTRGPRGDDLVAETPRVGGRNSSGTDRLPSKREPARPKVTPADVAGSKRTGASPRAAERVAWKAWTTGVGKARSVGPGRALRETSSSVLGKSALVRSSSALSTGTLRGGRRDVTVSPSLASASAGQGVAVVTRGSRSPYPEASVPRSQGSSSRFQQRSSRSIGSRTVSRSSARSAESPASMVPPVKPGVGAQAGRQARGPRPAASARLAASAGAQPGVASPNSARRPVSEKSGGLRPTAAGETGSEGNRLDEVPTRAHGSTYVNVCLDSSAEELTLISFNIQMLVDCCSLSVNWWSRERQLLPYLRKISDIHHPDVIIFQECWAEESWRLIQFLKQDKDCPFPYQTRILGSDNGPPCNCPDCGDCYCTCCQCCACLRSPCCCCCALACCLPPAAKLVGRANQMANASQAGEGQKDGEGRPRPSPRCAAPPDAWTSVSGNYQAARRNGGVVIVSKWPILEQHAYIYHNAAMPDCLENKGAVLVRIDKGGKIYNVVGTHLQSGDRNNDIRLAQLKELAVWLRSGMEECEQTEFASAEADEGAGDKSAQTADCTSARRQGRERRRKTKKREATRDGGSCCGLKRGWLPKGLVKATEPLIIGGDLNFRYKEDQQYILQAIRPDYLNCSLCLADPANPPTSYDTVLNDTCYNNNRASKVPIKQLIDFFLLSNDHFGSISRWQQTITVPADEPMTFRFFACLCMPIGSTQVHHVSDHLPVCVTIRHSKEN